MTVDTIMTSVNIVPIETVWILMTVVKSVIVLVLVHRSFQWIKPLFIKEILKVFLTK